MGFFPSQTVSLTYLARRSKVRGQNKQRSPPNSQPREGYRHLAVPHSIDRGSRLGSPTPPSCKSCGRLLGRWGGPTHVMLSPTNRESHREVETYSEAQTDTRHPPLTIARLTHALSRALHPICPLRRDALMDSDRHSFVGGASLSRPLTVPPLMPEEGKHQIYPITRAELG